MEAKEKHEATGTGPAASRLRPVEAPTEGLAEESGVAKGPSDAEIDLVDRARRGQNTAFRQLVETHQLRILRLAMRVLHCDRGAAEDICQEVFLRAFRGLANFDGKVRFSTWLHTIAMNTSITEYRRQRALKRGGVTVSLDAPIGGRDDEVGMDPASASAGPAARADQKEFAVAARQAVQELPDEFREAVVLRDLQGMSYEDIGAILGVVPGTVRSRIHRGRLLLQQKLKGFV